MSSAPRAQAPATPGKPCSLFGSRLGSLAFLGTLAVVVAVRLIGLRSMQAEVYGDIALVREYLDLIRQGRWPFYFALSSGPLYHYLVMPVIAVAGPGYFGMKLASVVVSLGVLAATFALSRRLHGDLLALLALFVSGVSSWLLIFSRLGNSQVVVPLLATTSLWLLVRFVQEQEQRDLVLSATIAALGFYGYPQSFILAPVMALTLVALRFTGQRVRWQDVGLYASTSVVVALPFFVRIVARDPSNFFSGYIGGKLLTSGEIHRVLLENVGRVVLSLHVHGDMVFRSNPVGRPHLDPVSGVLFLAGVVFWLQPARRRWSPAIFVPFLLQHVPSLLVLRAPAEVPSASRTLGTAPLAYVLVASGIVLLVNASARFRAARPVLAAVLLATVLGLNVARYLFEYLPGLPYGNTPIAALVSRYVDDLPAETEVYLVGCCWKDGMPEPKGIEFEIDRPERLHQLAQAEMSCDTLSQLPEETALVWDFGVPLPAPALAPCAAWIPARLYASPEGRPAFHAARLRRAATE